MEQQTPIAVGGHRLTWLDVDVSVREGIEQVAGARVVAETSKQGGFSPALASVLHLDDGRRVFAKAVNLSRNDFAVDAIRREAGVLAQLPVEVGAPGLLGAFDLGEWTAIVTEAIDGVNPAQPWRPDELRRFLAEAARLGEMLAQAPFAAEPFTEEADDLLGWSLLAEDEGKVARLEPAVSAYLADLIELEAPAPAAVVGEALLHGDLRSDNVLLTTDRVVAVDWPFASLGPAWLDLVLALPSIAMHGGGDPEEIWRAHPLSRQADPGAVTSVIAAVAGLFMNRSLNPPVPNLPTLRAFQTAQAHAALDWLWARRR